MKQYTKTKVIRISEIQLKTLQKMKSYNVDVGKFIRDAISDKIKVYGFGICWGFHSVYIGIGFNIPQDYPSFTILHLKDKT